MPLSPSIEAALCLDLHIPVASQAYVASSNTFGQPGTVVIDGPSDVYGNYKYVLNGNMFEIVQAKDVARTVEGRVGSAERVAAGQISLAFDGDVNVEPECSLDSVDEVPIRRSCPWVSITTKRSKPSLDTAPLHLRFQDLHVRFQEPSRDAVVSNPRTAAAPHRQRRGAMAIVTERMAQRASNMNGGSKRISHIDPDHIKPLPILKRCSDDHDK